MDNGDHLIESLIDPKHAGIFLDLGIQEILESGIYFIGHLSKEVLEKHTKEGYVL